jgi:hypothetical protein
MQLPSITQLKPDIGIGNFKIWLYEKEAFEIGYAIIACSSANSCVFLEGYYVDLDGLRGWKYECEKLYKTFSGLAELSFYEPHVKARITLNEKGQGSLYVEINCPDSMTEEHKYTFEIDQTYIGPLIQDLTKVLSMHEAK